MELLKSGPASTGSVSEVETSKQAPGRLLVICVDRDDDIGQKAGISTPVVGRDPCIEAAQRLALEDPEDADSNAMFSAIKTYEDLVSRGYRAEVVVVAGSARRGVEADEKIAAEVRRALAAFSASGAVVVSDGEDDESVIPVIQSVVPIVSVHRVVMKVSRSVEYSYAVLGKYVKMAAYDPKYSKFFLGVPGILLLIGGVATVFGYTAEIFAVLVSVLGGAFLVRAFDIDKAWANWAKPTPSGFIRIFAIIAGTILMLSSVPAGISVAGIEGADLVGQPDEKAVGAFVAGALPMLWAGMGLIFGGMLLSNWLSGVRRQISDSLRLIVLASLYPTVYQFTDIMVNETSSFSLLPPLLGGLAATSISAVLLFRRYRRRGDLS